MSWSILGKNNHVFLFQLVLHSLQYFRPSSLSSNWLFFHMHLILNRWSFLLFLWEIKSHHLKICWTSQTKSINPPAAICNSLCPPVMMEEVMFLFPLNPNPLQETCCLLLSLLFSFIFIHFRSLPPHPHPLSLLLFITYKPIQVCSNLKFHTPQAFTSLLPCCTTSWKHFCHYCHSHTHPSLLPNLFKSHLHPSLHRTAPPCIAAAALGPTGHEPFWKHLYTHSPGSSSSLGIFRLFPFLTFTPIRPIKVGCRLDFLGACFWVWLLLPLSIFSTVANSHGFKYHISDSIQILVFCQDLPSEIWNRGTSCHFAISTSNSGISKTERPKCPRVFSIPVNGLPRFVSQNPRHHLYLFSCKHSIQSFTTQCWFYSKYVSNLSITSLSCVGVEGKKMGSLMLTRFLSWNMRKILLNL